MSILNDIKANPSSRTAAAFFLGGIIFVIASIFLIFAPKGTYESTTGTITDIIEEYGSVDEHMDYDVIISYRAAGKRYNNAHYGAYYTGMKIGDTVEVLYNIEDPTEIQAPGYEKVPFITLAGGIVLIVFGTINFKKSKKKEDITGNVL